MSCILKTLWQRHIERWNLTKVWNSSMNILSLKILSSSKNLNQLADSWSNQYYMMKLTKLSQMSTHQFSFITGLWKRLTRIKVLHHKLNICVRLLRRSFLRTNKLTCLRNILSIKNQNMLLKIFPQKLSWFLRIINNFAREEWVKFLGILKIQISWLPPMQSIAFNKPLTKWKLMLLFGISISPMNLNSVWMLHLQSLISVSIIN